MQVCGVYLGPKGVALYLLQGPSIHHIDTWTLGATDETAPIIGTMRVDLLSRLSCSGTWVGFSAAAAAAAAADHSIPFHFDNYWYYGCPCYFDSMWLLRLTVRLPRLDVFLSTSERLVSMYTGKMGSEACISEHSPHPTSKLHPQAFAFKCCFSPQSTNTLNSEPPKVYNFPWLQAHLIAQVEAKQEGGWEP